jgi:tripartite-type tricarboxylate transporter receptor subunit TctC
MQNAREETMRLARRHVLRLAVTALAAPALPRAAAALDYPVRPLRVLIGFPAGGGADTVTRIIAQWLSDRLDQPVVVENKPGASTTLSLQAVASAPPDGYTLAYVGSSAAVSVNLLDNLTFNFVRDIVPVSGLIDFLVAMVVNPAIPAKTVPEFIAWARDNPGRVNIGSYGTGSTSHMALELFKSRTGLDIVHVPYRGEAPALTDIVSGQLHGMFSTMTGARPHIQSGGLRLLAMAGRNRSEFAPGAPTVGETLPGYEVSAWCGVGAPRGTPTEIIARLNAEINAGLADPGTRARLAVLTTTPIIHTPESFGALMASEVEKWGGVIKAAGIRAER